MKSRKATLCAAALLIAIGALFPLAQPSSAEPGAAASLEKAGGRARDCLGDASLEPGTSRVIRFIVWCSVQSGRIEFSLQRDNEDGRQVGAPSVSFTSRPSVSGPGAMAPPDCRRRGQTLSCSGRKAGPVVIRGTIAVPAGTRCDAPVRIDTADLVSQARPRGCDGTTREQAHFSPGYMRGFRSQFGLDEDLHGNRAAIDRRIRGIVASWRRGEPVARVTAAEIGQPLRPADQRRLEFRDELLERTTDALERWVPKHAADTYAGYEFDDHDGVVIYVGFTGDQEAQLAAFKRQAKLFAPSHIKPFPIQPLYSERALNDLMEKILDVPSRSPLGELIVDLELDTPANEVRVGTRDVARTRRLLAERFGAEAPIEVVYEEPGTLL